MSKTTTAALSHARVFSGSPQEIGNVRAFVGQLVDGWPVADDVVLLSSELATNAVLHSASGGGTFTVLVEVESGLVRVEVHDLGSAAAPAIQRPGQPSVSGVGLSLVEHIASRWGFYGGQGGRVVWFEMDRG